LDNEMVEEWRGIVGYEGMYEVSSFGMIKSLPRYYSPTETILAPFLRRGYPSVGLTIKGDCKFHTVHKIVANAFLLNEENKPQINHKDGDKTNNHVSNLEWVTAKENVQHALATGLNKAIGKTHYKSKKGYILSPFKQLFYVDCATEFSKVHGLDKWCLSRVMRGERPHHKQWRPPE